MSERRAEEEEAHRKFVTECVAINPDKVQSEYVRLPTDVAYWGNRYAERKKKHLLLRAKRKRVFAAARMRAREALTAKTGLRVTESMVDDRAELDSLWQEHQDDEVRAEADKIVAGAVLDALEAKRDMLISLGATLRQEHGSTIVIRGRRDRDQDGD